MIKYLICVYIQNVDYFTIEFFIWKKSFISFPVIPFNVFSCLIQPWCIAFRRKQITNPHTYIKTSLKSFCYLENTIFCNNILIVLAGNYRPDKINNGISILISSIK